MSKGIARGHKSAIEELLGDLEAEADKEIQAEAVAQLTPQQRAMAEVAQKLLRMERDMLLPGSEQGTSERVARIGNFIEGQDF